MGIITEKLLDDADRIAVENKNRQDAKKTIEEFIFIVYLFCFVLFVCFVFVLLFVFSLFLFCCSSNKFYSASFKSDLIEISEKTSFYI